MGGQSGRKASEWLRGRLPPTSWRRAASGRKRKGKERLEVRQNESKERRGGRREKRRDSEREGE